MVCDLVWCLVLLLGLQTTNGLIAASSRLQVAGGSISRPCASCASQPNFHSKIMGHVYSQGRKGPILRMKREATGEARPTTILQNALNNAQDALPDALPDLSEPIAAVTKEVGVVGKKIKKWSIQNWLILGEIAVIFAAWLNPAFGATGGPLKPEFTISKVAIFVIFFINGIALEIGGSQEEVAKSAKSNLFIQFFNFGLMAMTAKFLAPFYPNPEFRDGLLLLGCLPVTINISVAQTLSAGCDMGTAIFNAIFGNVIGVVLTPLLSLSMLGASGSVSLLGTLRKLGGIVIAPLICGQLARLTKLRVLAEKYTRQSRNFSSCLLLAIVYNIFSDTFNRGLGIKKEMLVNLFTIMPLSYLSFSYLFWLLSKRVLPGLDLKTRGAGLLIAPSKTMAFGIPFIKTAMGSRPDIAYLLAPLLLYAPSQLLLGSSIVVPFLQKRIDESQKWEAGGGI